MSGSLEPYPTLQTQLLHGGIPDVSECYKLCKSTTKMVFSDFDDVARLREVECKHSDAEHMKIYQTIRDIVPKKRLYGLYKGLPVLVGETVSKVKAYAVRYTLYGYIQNGSAIFGYRVVEIGKNIDRGGPMFCRLEEAVYALYQMINIYIPVATIKHDDMMLISNNGLINFTDVFTMCSIFIPTIADVNGWMTNWYKVLTLKMFYNNTETSTNITVKKPTQHPVDSHIRTTNKERLPVRESEAIKKPQMTETQKSTTTEISKNTDKVKLLIELGKKIPYMRQNVIRKVKNSPA